MSDAEDGPGGAGVPDDGGDGTEGTDGDVKRTRPCPYCGASMVHRHCEYVCPQHGVVYDCSDPFYG